MLVSSSLTVKLLLLVSSSLLHLCAAQTFSGFQPATHTTLYAQWGNLVLKYSGEVVNADSVQPLATVGLAGLCDKTYLLVMVDPDATQGNIETQVGLHTIQGNFTCSLKPHILNGTVYRTLMSDSPALAPYISPEPQPTTKTFTHRYTLLLFEQPPNYKVAPQFEYALPLNPSNVTNRIDFNIQAYAASIGKPLVAANVFDVIDKASSSTTSASSDPPNPASKSVSTVSSTASSAGSGRSKLIPSLISGLAISSFIMALAAFC